jgi:hypothetical protein
MHMHHERTLSINKKQLIDKITENKQNHIAEFHKAVEAFKVEASKQLEDVGIQLGLGHYDKVKLNLVLPVNRSDEYDKVIKMFEWEVDDIISLTQGEFNEYVHDENSAAKQASISNAFYLSSSR